MRVKLNSASSPVPMADIAEPAWRVLNEYKYLALFDSSTGYGIELVYGPNAKYTAYILTPTDDLYQGPIYNCPFDLAVELMETYYWDADTGYYHGESLPISSEIATHIVRVMAPGRGLLFGT